MTDRQLNKYIKLTLEHRHGCAREDDFDMGVLAKLGLAEWNKVGVWQATEKGRALVAQFCQIASASS